MSEIAVNIKNITKEYQLYNAEIDRLKESIHPFRKSYHTTFYALNDVSFSIKKGEKIGIIGANGAGKSTLLKIITGVLEQTKGEIEINGSVASLLELGAGFNPDYTGIENIRLNGTIMGLDEQEVEDRIPRIIEFADIGEFINQPVKSYSSGMFVRLAFATQIFSNPDILIVDEALSVGDVRFQQKCYRAMDELMRDKTVIIVTHDTAAVTKFCSRVVVMNKGMVSFDGDVYQGLKIYQGDLIEDINSLDTDEYEDASDVNSEHTSELATENNENLDIPKINSDVVKKGNGYADIVQCGLYLENQLVKELKHTGVDVTFKMVIDYRKKVENPLIGLAIRDRLGNEIIAINSETIGCKLEEAEGKICYELSFRMPNLNAGDYLIAVAVANGCQLAHTQLCWIDDAVVYTVTARKYDIPGTIYMDKGSISTIKCR